MAGTTKFVSGWETDGNKAGLQVAFAFGSAPFASTCTNMFDRTWYAASTSVRNVQTFRGRTHDLDQFGPGTATIVLDNRSRLYDPAATTADVAATFGPHCIPGTPVKIQWKNPGGAAVHNAWCGFAESFQLDYPGMKDATVTVRCVDGMKYLNLSACTQATTADLTGAMVNDVLDHAGWPSTSTDSIGWRDVSPGLSSGLRYKGFRTPALEMCRNLADSEAGLFFVDQFGRTIFRTRRYWKMSYASTEAIFGDAASATSELAYTDLQLASDDYQLYNKVTVSRVRGPVQSTWSTASIGTYGERVLSKNNLLCPRSTEAKQLARWMVARYKNPGVRVERLACKPRTSTGHWKVLPSIVLGTAVRVMRRPPGGGSFSQLCHVEGIQHDISVTDDDWSLSFNMTPAALFPSSSL
jgi:hypothetical protein